MWRFVPLLTALQPWLPCWCSASGHGILSGGPSVFEPSTGAVPSSPCSGAACASLAAREPWRAAAAAAAEAGWLAQERSVAADALGLTGQDPQALANKDDQEEEGLSGIRTRSTVSLASSPGGGDQPQTGYTHLEVHLKIAFAGDCPTPAQQTSIDACARSAIAEVFRREYDFDSKGKCDTDGEGKSIIAFVFELKLSGDFVKAMRVEAMSLKAMQDSLSRDKCSDPNIQFESFKMVPTEYRMSGFDKLNLQMGWLLTFIAIVLAGLSYLWIQAKFGAGILQEDNLAVSTQGQQKHPLVCALWGEGQIGVTVDVATVVISLANFYAYLVLTEWMYVKMYEDGDGDYEIIPLRAWLGPWFTPYNVNWCVESVSLIVFSVLSVLRLSAVTKHPDWKDYGWTAIPRYAVCNIYMVLEIYALWVSVYGVVRQYRGFPDDVMNVLWLFAMRIFEMLGRTYVGYGFVELKSMVASDGKLLLSSYVLGIVVWLLLSSCYFLASEKEMDQDEPSLLWASAKPPAADSEENPGWDRHESIPATMWFVLINLTREHPGADWYTCFWPRFWVVISCIFAMPIFAIPTCILQSRIVRSDDIPDQDHSLLERKLAWADPLRLYKMLLTAALALISIQFYFACTARDIHYESWNGFPAMTVSLKVNAIVDGVVGGLFALEWAVRCFVKGWAYWKQPYAYIDLVAWIFGIFHLILFLWGMEAAFFDDGWGAWLRAASVLRIFKLERYVHSWKDLKAICSARRSILLATLAMSLLAWMLFSQLFYITERSSPDEEMREAYGSVMRSLWAELINLHGEWPWVDYSSAGKGVGVIAVFFSIIIFCIPISIFSDGFMEIIEDDRDTSDESFDRRRWQERCRPEADGVQRKFYDLFYENLHTQPGFSFKLARALSMLSVGVVTFVTLLSTLDQAHPLAPSLLLATGLDAICLVYFVLEYICRVLATGWRHPCSFAGLCDLLSLAAIAATLLVYDREEVFHPFDNQNFAVVIVVPLRILRLFSLDSYFGAVCLLGNVFYLERRPLARAGVATLQFWLVHATLLYLFEKPGSAAGSAAKEEHLEDIRELLGQQPLPTDDLDGLKVKMWQRYISIPRALQFSILHIFGDYPETEYCLNAKVVHFVGIMVGIGVMGAFAGVFAAGFVNYLQEERRRKLKAIAETRILMFTSVVLRLQRVYRKNRAKSKQRASGLRQAEGDGVGAELRTPQTKANPLKRVARMVKLEEKSRCAKTVRHVLFFVLSLSVLNGLAMSLPECVESKSLFGFCLAVEVACSCIFFLEWVLGLIATPTRCCCSFWGVLDLLCLFPGFVWIMATSGLHLFSSLAFLSTLQNRVEAFIMLRACRLLNHDFFRKELVVIGRAMRGASGMLGTPAYLALCIWIATSTWFMWVENYNQEVEPNALFLAATTQQRELLSSEGLDLYVSEAGNFDSIPSAMYWCSIFLIGEWANVDFTFWGSRLCIFYVLFGITAFSVPVGILVEAIQAAMEAMDEERKSFRDALATLNNIDKQRSHQSRRRSSLAAGQTRQNAAIELVPAGSCPEGSLLLL